MNSNPGSRTHFEGFVVSYWSKISCVILATWVTNAISIFETSLLPSACFAFHGFKIKNSHYLLDICGCANCIFLTVNFTSIFQLTLLCIWGYVERTRYDMIWYDIWYDMLRYRNKQMGHNNSIIQTRFPSDIHKSTLNDQPRFISNFMLPQCLKLYATSLIFWVTTDCKM